MKVVFENDVPEEFKLTFTLKITPGIVNDVGCLRSGKHRQPTDDRASHEIGIFGFKDSVATSAHGSSCGETELLEMRSQAELGNELTRQDSRLLPRHLLPLVPKLRLGTRSREAELRRPIHDKICDYCGVTLTVIFFSPRRMTTSIACPAFCWDMIAM